MFAELATRMDCKMINRLHSRVPVAYLAALAVVSLCWSCDNQQKPKIPSTSSVLGNESNAGKTLGTERESQHTSTLEGYESGNYKVGVDIPSGIYVLLVSKEYTDLPSPGYFAISKDPNKKKIVANDNFGGNSIIEVLNGEYLQLSRCTAIPLDKAPDLKPTGGVYQEGMYIVGRHVPPGEYVLKTTDEERDGYIALYPDARHKKILTNYLFKKKRYVKIENGQYLKLSHCRMEKAEPQSTSTGKNEEESESKYSKKPSRTDIPEAKRNNKMELNTIRVWELHDMGVEVRCYPNGAIIALTKVNDHSMEDVYRAFGDTGSLYHYDFKMPKNYSIVLKGSNFEFKSTVIKIHNFNAKLNNGEDINPDDYIYARSIE